MTSGTSEAVQNRYSHLIIYPTQTQRHSCARWKINSGPETRIDNTEELARRLERRANNVAGSAARSAGQLRELPALAEAVAGMMAKLSVGRCRLTVSTPALKVPMVSALESAYNLCFQFQLARLHLGMPGAIR